MKKEKSAFIIAGFENYKLLQQYYQDFFDGKEFIYLPFQFLNYPASIISLMKEEAKKVSFTFEEPTVLTEDEQKAIHVVRLHSVYPILLQKKFAYAKAYIPGCEKCYFVEGNGMNEISAEEYFMEKGLAIEHDIPMQKILLPNEKRLES